MQAGSPGEVRSVVGATDVRGKHRIAAEVKRLEQETRFLELSKKMMNSRKISPADGSQYKDSAVGLVFMESGGGQVEPAGA
ncbi:guanine nucleotide-binding protein subunit gamma 2 [Dorcoceras hygrometricum]|uniref:Guanine nucleotide-binding protein subunit gamma 2 n=1 Tax=Dorcoceras hygrometricum TaxID=472368 RepID=A0A2Z7B3F4_9LAMI|nr:guanine nucleotide-binding protein subunit gamma 2 [Dorcoceras hygrometricum]